jgi:molybdopterin converting factor small subunit
VGDVAETGKVIVEFYGIPRQRAGRAELHIAASTVGDALTAITRACPNLRDLVSPEGRLPAHYLLSLDGREFLRDLERPLLSGARLLLLSADTGG